ncbi:hypothetical protein WG66_013396 [Moniliophthora roreri]|nr:hypothetical protein WG66_013396 [Moniliophthora roreri]
MLMILVLTGVLKEVKKLRAEKAVDTWQVADLGHGCCDGVQPTAAQIYFTSINSMPLLSYALHELQANANSYNISQANVHSQV